MSVKEISNNITAGYEIVSCHEENQRITKVAIKNIHGNEAAQTKTKIFYNWAYKNSSHHIKVETVETWRQIKRPEPKIKERNVMRA